MKHSNSGRKFSRSPSHRKALFRNLAKALIQHGRIITTEMKAKDLRGVVEPLITLAKRNDLHSRRLAYKELNDHKIVKYLFDEIGPLFAETKGGYTRVLKLAKHRKGDNAPMAIIEFTRRKGEPAAPSKNEKRENAVKTPTSAAPEESVPTNQNQPDKAPAPSVGESMPSESPVAEKN